jgi:hypothetical protein
LFIGGVASAQKSKPTTVKSDTVKSDTVKNKFLPTGIRLGTDLLGPVKSKVQSSFTGWEVNADVDFYRYYVTVDYGSWGRNYQTDSASYSNNGKYWRIGTDVNFLLKDPERNMFFLGFRYGHSTFSENLNIIAVDPVWGTLNHNYVNPNVTSRWLELTTGIRVKIWEMIWMGYTARYKFGLKNQGDDAMLPHDVPGYGRTDKNSYWGFNYQIFIRIPFRKTPVFQAPKKK